MTRNSKIASINPPVWASFPGFSVLFQQSSDVERSRHFYQALSKFTKSLPGTNGGLVFQEETNYHVTAWDGINSSNVDLLAQSSRSLATSLLQCLPASLSAPNVFFDVVMASKLYQNRWSLSFDFKDLSVIRNTSLAARLKVKKGYEREFLSFCSCRNALNREFREKFGHQNYDNFEPHVTLGYFFETDHAEHAKDRITDWSNLVREDVAGLSLPVSDVEIYGFQDMAAFIPRSDLKIQYKEGEPYNAG